METRNKSRETYSRTYHFSATVETDEQRILFFTTRKAATEWAKDEAKQSGGKWFVWSH